MANLLMVLKNRGSCSVWPGYSAPCVPVPEASQCLCALSWPDSWKARSTFLARCRENAVVQPLRVPAGHLVASYCSSGTRGSCGASSLEIPLKAGSAIRLLLTSAPQCSAEPPCKGPASFPRSFSGTLPLKDAVNGNCCA